MSEAEPSHFSYWLDHQLDRWIGGHIRLGRVVIFGRNAMHFAWQLRMKRGYLVFLPPVRCFRRWWPWALYYSPNATPGFAWWGKGPGFDGGSDEERRWNRINAASGPFDA